MSSLLLLLLLHLTLLFSSSLSAAEVAQSPASPSNSSTVYDILQEFKLPPGILPDTVKSFSVSSNGYFVIDLYGECYVDFEYVVYYAPRVSGFLGYGSVSNLEGIQIRSYLIWYDVSSIKVDLPYSDFVYIQFGWVTRKLGIDQFQHIHSCRGNLSLFQRVKKAVRSGFEVQKMAEKLRLAGFCSAGTAKASEEPRSESKTDVDAGAAAVALAVSSLFLFCPIPPKGS